MKKLLFLSLILFFSLSAFSQKKKAEEYFGKGEIKYNNGDYSGAIADYSMALEAFQKYPEALYKRGLAKTYLGDAKGAIADFQEAIKYRLNYSEAWFECAYQKYEIEDYEGALHDYSKVIELRPRDRDAWYNRGLCKYQLGDYAGSMNDNTKALEIDPTYVSAWYNRSLCRFAMKDYKGTINDNLEILKIKPDYTNAYYYIGLGRYYLGEYEESVEAYTKVLEKKPDYANAYYNRGLAKHYLKDYQGAIKDFNKVLELDPKDEEAYYRRGLARYHLNDLQGSISDYTKALEIDPSYSSAKKELEFVTAEVKRNSGTTSTDVDNVNIEINVKMPQVWAVVVGVSTYKDPKMNLKYADKDAIDFYNFLKSPQGGSLSDDHIVLLTNEKATRGNIIKALNEKFYRAFEDDMVILFFASHGQPDPVGNEVYFLSHDAESDNLGGTAVSQIDIEKVFQRTRAKKKLWIADACHSGGAGLQVRADHSALTNKLLSEIANSNSGMAMLTASSSSEYSYEDQKWGGGHGVFTHFLLKGLKGEADKDNNGLVELRELYEYVYRQVSHDTNGQQHPELKGSFDNKLPVAVYR
jgi:tetratricopeptide (TPR) repeat protein